MELTPIQYLSAYLPYDLEGKCNVYPHYTKFDIKCILRSVSIAGVCQVQCFNSAGSPWNEENFVQIKDFKPLLHPLSKLIEEIEHNGERFVPVQWFRRNMNLYLSYQSLNPNLPTIPAIPDPPFYWVFTAINNMDIQECYQISAKLLEWHFDIFRIIEEGKAVEK